MRPLELFTFHNNESAIVNGKTYNVYTGEMIMLEIIATGTFSATVQGKVSENGTWKNIEMTMDVIDKSLNAVINNPNHAYQVDISGWGFIRVILTANVGVTTIVGRVMSQ